MLFWQLVCLSTLELHSACLEFMTREVFQMNTGKNEDGSKFVLFPDCWHENFEKGKFSCLSPSLVLQLPGSSATPSPLCEGTSINHHSRCLLHDFWGISLTSIFPFTACSFRQPYVWAIDYFYWERFSSYHKTVSFGALPFFQLAIRPMLWKKGRRDSAQLL